MIVGDNDDLDTDYFKQLIESKLDNGEKQSYMAAFAMKQLSGDIDPEGKYPFPIPNNFSEEL